MPGATTVALAAVSGGSEGDSQRMCPGRRGRAGVVVRDELVDGALGDVASTCDTHGARGVNAGAGAGGTTKGRGSPLLTSPIAYHTLP